MLHRGTDVDPGHYVSYDLLRSFSTLYAGSGSKSLVEPDLGLILCSHGYSGNFAVTEGDVAARRVWMLWRYHTLLWSAMDAAMNAVYQKLIELGAEERREKAGPVLPESFKEFGQVLTLLVQEANTEAMCGDGLDHAIWTDMGASWRTEPTIETVRQRYGDLMEMVARINAEAQRLGQQRMNKILFAVTMLTFIGLVAQIVAFLDFDNEWAGLGLRVALLGVTTALFWFFFGLFSGYWLWRRRRRAKP